MDSLRLLVKAGLTPSKVPRSLPVGEVETA